MDRVFLRRALLLDSDRLLNELSDRQYLQPQRPLSEALQELCDDADLCPTAVARAVQWLALDGQAPIGRLRRTELTQLARSIHRFWRQMLSIREKQPQA